MADVYFNVSAKFYPKTCVIKSYNKIRAREREAGLNEPPHQEGNGAQAAQTPPAPAGGSVSRGLSTPCSPQKAAQTHPPQARGEFWSHGDFLLRVRLGVLYKEVIF